MATKSGSDIDDALDLYVGDNAPRKPTIPSVQRAPKQEPPAPKRRRSKLAKHEQPKRGTEVAGRGARRGRPKGIKSGEGPLREKKSLYVRSDVAAAYEKWSWEAQSNPGLLYEEALLKHLQRNGRSIEKNA